MLLEVTRSIHGAWRVAMLDRNALAYFNVTIDGFWRSFGALGVVAPMYIGFLILSHGKSQGLEIPAEALPAMEWYIAVKLLAFTAGWLVFAAVMVPISRLLDLSDNYVQCIIVWNWANVLAMAVILPAVLFFLSGAVTGQAAAMIPMAAQITLFFYGYLVARIGLFCKPLTAIGIVAMDFLLTLLFNGLASRLL
jgi:uncharacterized membrane protein YozB (DUF420 family)